MSNQNTVTREGQEDYIGWARWRHRGDNHQAYLSICDSDAEGAFKIYRHSQGCDGLRSQKAALESQLAEAKAAIGTILIERETAKEQLAEARKAIDEAGKLSTGWKHGNEGIHLLKIQSILSGHGEAIDAAGALRAKPKTK